VKIDPAFRFAHRIRVRYSEGDQQGVVFNARYLDYADIAVTEYWRAVGFRLAGEGAVEFHVARAEVDFKKPIYPDEMIDLYARIERFGNSSMSMLIEIHGARDDGTADLRATVREVHVHIDLPTHKPMTIPQYIRDKFIEFDAREVFLTTGDRGI
jgi:acyl-CoA thioester hydrolase